MIDRNRFGPGNIMKDMKVAIVGARRNRNGIGEYIGRIYDGVNFRPEYIIEKRENFD